MSVTRPKGRERSKVTCAFVECDECLTFRQLRRGYRFHSKRCARRQQHYRRRGGRRLEGMTVEDAYALGYGAGYAVGVREQSAKTTTRLSISH